MDLEDILQYCKSLLQQYGYFHQFLPPSVPSTSIIKTYMKSRNNFNSILISLKTFVGVVHKSLGGSFTKGFIEHVRIQLSNFGNKWVLPTEISLSRRSLIFLAQCALLTNSSCHAGTWINYKIFLTPQFEAKAKLFQLLKYIRRALNKKLFKNIP